jgi:Ferritin-like domain
MQPTLTRRAALGGGAALALASCGGGDPPPAAGPRAGSGAGLLSSIVALEHAAIAAWAAIGEVLTGEGRGYAREIRAREVANAERMAELVRELGGTPPKARMAADYERLFPRLESEADALHFARDLEERLVRAYLEGVRLLPDAEQRRAAAEIAGAQAEDLAVVHALSGEPAAPQAFVTGTL